MRDPEATVIVHTNRASVDQAGKATKLGVFDYVAKSEDGAALGRLHDEGVATVELEVRAGNRAALRPGLGQHRGIRPTDGARYAARPGC